jgi:type IV secretory pathway VirD2 relaxase
MSRRVTIKTLLVNQRNASPQSLAKHLRYIERDGAGRTASRAVPTGRRPTKPTSMPSRNAARRPTPFPLHRLPEDGAELDDLRTYTRHLMNRMEADLGRGWIGWRSITGTPTTRTRT